MISVVDADAVCWYPAPAQKSVHHKCNSEAAGVALIEYISVSLAIVQISAFRNFQNFRLSLMRHCYSCYRHQVSSKEL